MSKETIQTHKSSIVSSFSPALILTTMLPEILNALLELTLLDRLGPNPKKIPQNSGKQIRIPARFFQFFPDFWAKSFCSKSAKTKFLLCKLGMGMKLYYINCFD